MSAGFDHRSAAAAQCFGIFLDPSDDDAAAAAALMARRVTLSPHPEVALPAEPTWREDPLGDANWRFTFHTLRWADVLRREGSRTGDQAMLDRHGEILQSWIAANPREAPASPDAYGDMQTGLRALVLACAVAAHGPAPWLLAALRDHGEILYNPAFGPRFGNHALHVRIGLLVAGAVLPDAAWTATAIERIEELLRLSVDEEGVTDEGSTGYAWMNYRWYGGARRRVEAAGATPPAAFDRLARVPDFLGRATRPDGRYEQLGDSGLRGADPVPGTVSEYAASRGAAGTRPAGVYDVFARGYVFGRSGWGEERPFEQEDFYSIRFGLSDAEQVHDHRDHTALTVHAHGGQLLFDNGRGKYGANAMRAYLGSVRAHNAVDVTGAVLDREARATLEASVHTGAYDLTTVRSAALTGAPRTRTVLYSRTGRYFVVHDRIDLAASGEVTQSWHLATGRTFHTTRSTISSSGAGPNLTMFWLGQRPAVTVAEGETDPLLGWRSYAYGEYFPAPVVQARAAGTTVRLTTVIVPRPAGPAAPIRVTGATVVGDEVSATVDNRGLVEAFRFSPSDAAITSGA